MGGARGGGGGGGGALGLGPAARALREAAWRGSGRAGAERAGALLAALGPRAAAAALAEGCAESGWTALHCALFFGRLALARELLACGASAEAPDAQGRTPLDLLGEELRPLLGGGGGAGEGGAGLRGEIVAWGNGANFQLGTGAGGVQEAPARVECLRGRAVSAVAGGKFHSCALDGGRLWTWGHGRGGRLGHPEFDVHSGQVAVIAPRRVRAGLPPGCRVLAVSAAKHHTAAVCSGGLVFTWGSNRDGQLGYAGVDSQPTPRRVREVRAAVRVSAANRHTAVVTEGGSVFSWGANGHGQLGYGTSDAGNGVPRLVEALRGKHVVKLSASKRHTVCVTDEGDVLAWGHRAVMPRRVHLPEGRGSTSGVKFHRGHADVHRPVAVDVAAGAAHSTVLTLAGVPMVWRSADPLLRAVEVPLPEGVRGASVSAGKERTAVVTECGNLYVWEGKSRALEAALRRESGSGAARSWSGPGRPELVPQVRHAAGVAVGEKHSLCLLQTYQPPLPPPPSGAGEGGGTGKSVGVPSLHALAQRALMEHVADARNALVLSEVAGDLQAAELQGHCQRMALGNLDLLIAADSSCLGAVSAECIEDLERMACSSRVADPSPEPTAGANIAPLVPEGGGALPLSLPPHLSYGWGGFFDRATAPGSAHGGPNWPGSPPKSRRDSLSGALEPTFSDLGRSVGDREESERLARNVRKKLQQIETLEGLENERGAGALDAQQRAKVGRKAEYQSALFLLEEGAVPSADVAAMIGASVGRRDLTPPSASSSAPSASSSAPPAPPAPPCGRLACTGRMASGKKTQRKHKKAAPVSLALEGGASWGDAPDPVFDAPPPAKPRLAEASCSAGTLADQDSSLRGPDRAAPPAPRTPQLTVGASASRSLVPYNYTAKYPELGAEGSPPGTGAPVTLGFSAAQGPRSSGGAGPEARKNLSKGRKGTLSMFLKGGLDARLASGPSQGDSTRTNWGKSPAKVPQGGGPCLRGIMEEQGRSGQGSGHKGRVSAGTGPPGTPAFSPSSPSPSLSTGRAVLGDFLGGTSRGSFGSSPPAWGGAAEASPEPPSILSLQAEELELRKRRLLACGGSPGASSSPPLGWSPKQHWYRHESHETSFAKDLREIQSEELQALAAQEALAVQEAAAARDAAVAREASTLGGVSRTRRGRKGREPAGERQTAARGKEDGQRRRGKREAAEGSSPRGPGSQAKGRCARTEEAPPPCGQRKRGGSRRTTPQRTAAPAPARGDQARAAAARALEALF